jgi:hypothetical protein
MVDTASGLLVASESQRRDESGEVGGKPTGNVCARKLAQRLGCDPKFRSVVFFTDSKVAEA